MRPARGNVTGLNWCSTVGLFVSHFFRATCGNVSHWLLCERHAIAGLLACLDKT